MLGRRGESCLTSHAPRQPCNSSPRTTFRAEQRRPPTCVSSLIRADDARACSMTEQGSFESRTTASWQRQNPSQSGDVAHSGHGASAGHYERKRLHYQEDSSSTNRPPCSPLQQSTSTACMLRSGRMLLTLMRRACYASELAETAARACNDISHLNLSQSCAGCCHTSLW